MMTDEKKRKERAKRRFGAGILLLMAALAICTIAFAETGSSYSLTIVKEFGENPPPGAATTEYTFKVQGNEIGSDELFERIVTIEGNKSQKITFERPVEVTVTELTDPSPAEPTAEPEASPEDEEKEEGESENAVTIGEDDEESDAPTYTKPSVSEPNTPQQDDADVEVTTPADEQAPGDTDQNASAGDASSEAGTDSSGEGDSGDGSNTDKPNEEPGEGNQPENPSSDGSDTVAASPEGDGDGSGNDGDDPAAGDDPSDGEESDEAQNGNEPSTDTESDESGTGVSDNDDSEDTPDMEGRSADPDGDGTKVTSPGNRVDLESTDRSVSTNVSGTKYTVTISRKDKGKITITRPPTDPKTPETRTDTTFRITHKLFEEHEGETRTIQDQQIAAGCSVTLEDLPMGTYEIEELKADPGFSVTATQAALQSKNDRTPPTYINTDHGSMTINAPENAASGCAYYFRIQKDGQPYTYDGLDEIAIKPGESFKLKELPKGEYVIVATRVEAPSVQGFEIEYPTGNTVSREILRSNFTSNDATKPKFYYWPVSCNSADDYIDNLKYGPLRSDTGIIREDLTYSFYFGYTNDEGGRSYWTRSNRAGNKPYPETTVQKVTIKDGKFWTAVWKCKSTTATKLPISWTEHTTKTVEAKDSDPPGTAYRVVNLDERGWIDIKKKLEPTFRVRSTSTTSTPYTMLRAIWSRTTRCINMARMGN